MTESGLTDFDLYLFGEGKHERIYEKLGAHPYSASQEAGTRFAVWAPNAERVSVVGAFNHWDGRTHVMHGRAASGIWELAIPGLGLGTIYKYEIRDRDGPSVRQGGPLRLRDAAASGELLRGGLARRPCLG